MFKLRKLKSEKGMSGVLVALLLVMIGVGLVGGIAVWMDGNLNNISAKGDNAMSNAL